MSKQNPVKSIMTEKVVTIEISKPLQEANDIILKNAFRHLPVVENGKLKGILSLTDIQRMAFAQELGDSQLEADNVVFEMLTIEQVMKHDPKVIKESDSIESAAKIFTEVEFHALPVVDSSGELSGIVTTSDIIKSLI